jgi:AraC-like DNA-binding protein
METPTAPPSPVGTRRGVSWPDLLGEHFVELDVATDLPGPVQGTVQSRTVGGLQLSRVRSVDQRVHRTPGLTRSDPRSYLQMGLVETGRGRVQQDGRECWLGAGDFVLYETTRPFSWELLAPPTGASWTLLVLTWSRSSLPLLAAESEDLTARRLDGQSGITGVLGRMVRDLVTSQDVVGPGAQVAGELGRLVTSVAAASSGPVGHAPDTPGRRALARAVRQHIEHRLGDPGLDPRTIAAAHFISVRQLHRLFAEQDETVARYIRRRRLERCRDELLRSPGSSLTSIAHRFGFPDPGAFGRSFRAAYGTSPSQYRASGGRAPMPGTDRPLGIS